MKEFNTLHWVSINETTDIENLPDGHYELKFKDNIGVYSNHIVIGIKCGDLMIVVLDGKMLNYDDNEIESIVCEYRLIRVTGLSDSEYIYFDINIRKYHKTSISEILSRSDEQSLVYQLAADIAELRGKK